MQGNCVGWENSHRENRFEGVLWAMEEAAPAASCPRAMCCGVTYPEPVVGQGEVCTSSRHAVHCLVAGLSSVILSNLTLHLLDLAKICFIVGDGLELGPNCKGVPVAQLPFKNSIL